MSYRVIHLAYDCKMTISDEISIEVHHSKKSILLNQNSSASPVLI